LGVRSAPDKETAAITHSNSKMMRNALIPFDLDSDTRRTCAIPLLEYLI
jgi:hypothetical protein